MQGSIMPIGPETRSVAGVLRNVATKVNASVVRYPGEDALGRMW